MTSVRWLGLTLVLVVCASLSLDHADARGFLLRGRRACPVVVEGSKGTHVQFAYPQNDGDTVPGNGLFNTWGYHGATVNVMAVLYKSGTDTFTGTLLKESGNRWTAKFNVPVTKSPGTILVKYQFKNEQGMFVDGPDETREIFLYA